MHTAPAVSVITRTRDRALFLKRAALSVAAQTFRDLEWVVVNDGGEDAGVDAAADEVRRLGLAVSVVHHEQRRGMEAAANSGVRAASGRYVVLLDDDDTWHEDFLRETTGKLDACPHLAAVCTQNYVVRERMAEGGIEELERFVMNGELRSASYVDFFLFNRFTNNSFLYRASLHRELGPFDETMPVMGDWKFVLDVLRTADVGVVPLPLARYHQRVGVVDAHLPEANTVVAAQQVHAETDAAFRNRLIREDMDAGRIGPGTLMALGRLRLRGDEIFQHRIDGARHEIVAQVCAAVARSAADVRGASEEHLARLGVAVSEAVPAVRQGSEEIRTFVAAQVSQAVSEAAAAILRHTDDRIDRLEQAMARKLADATAAIQEAARDQTRRSADELKAHMDRERPSILARMAANLRGGRHPLP